MKCMIKVEKTTDLYGIQIDSKMGINYNSKNGKQQKLIHNAIKKEEIRTKLWEIKGKVDKLKQKEYIVNMEVITNRHNSNMEIRKRKKYTFFKK
ncbi:3449_t:CDS:2 [Gigaspora rosea]|nr:3449_t:CDS:2 [Gigaspora rosea]